MKQSRGSCVYCGAVTTKGGMLRHLAACAKRKAAIEQANLRGEKKETLYHLRVQDAWQGVYWLHLEMPGASTLRNLDSYLRGIWLDCCGHLSQFTLKAWQGNKIPMTRTIEQVFRPDLELTHIYDFGTSSYTLVKMVGAREGVPTTRHPIVLMARNLRPEFKCIECAEPAAWLCMECLIEADEAGTLCDKHAKRHPHEDYGEPVELVNSPRMGMCGYTGPADPPY